jgi:hypothetical protein
MLIDDPTHGKAKHFEMHKLHQHDADGSVYPGYSKASTSSNVQSDGAIELAIPSSKLGCFLDTRSL